MSAARARSAVLALAALSAAGLLAAPAGAVPACGDQSHEDDCGKANIYPCCDNGGNCTWWAWEAVCRNWHVGLVNWGNANTWASNAKLDPSYDVLGSPVVGSVATRDLGADGHVAWVTAVNGGTITVTEENCCVGCASGLDSHNYAAGYFDSGYVVQHGVACACSSGDTQTQACGDCGTQTRGCDGCEWGGWGGCGGPDPDGGNDTCDTGGLGPCASGHQRCVGGNTACVSDVQPSPELCDGIDNDCNGLVDDGDPQMFGPTLPDYAATMMDVSYPQALGCGESGAVWVEFRNDGAKPWVAGGVWLGAHGAASGGASALFAPGAWPAWDVAAITDQEVLPGETGRFTFEITAAAAAAGTDVVETFQLEVPGGPMMACPSTTITPTIHVLPASWSAGGAGGVGGAPPDAKSGSAVGGCSHAPSGDARVGGWGAALVAALFAASRARRAPRSERRSSRG